MVGETEISVVITGDVLLNVNSFPGSNKGSHVSRVIPSAENQLFSVIHGEIFIL
jgi:hypothetical protein